MKQSTPMQNKDKVLQFYHSGRYQCDLFFYQSLSSIIKQLNLYQYQPILHQNHTIIQNITKIAELNSKCLEEQYDEEEIHSQTVEIKKLLKSINTAHIATIIAECEDMYWESYEEKVYKLIKHHQDYEAIYQRINKSIHDEKLRLEYLLTLSLFYMVNHSKVELSKMVRLYEQTIEKMYNYLTDSKKQIDMIRGNAKVSNICSLEKVRNYVGTVVMVLRMALRLCEITKILTGKNNLSLRFNQIKKDLQKIQKEHQSFKIPKERALSKAFILDEFKKWLKHHQYNLKINKVCRWCLYQTKQHDYHESCQEIVKFKF